MHRMKRRGIKLLAVLWLVWYLSGPLFETIDSWDSPQEEIGDIIRSAGGAVTLIAVVVYFGMVSFRKLRERCLYLARAVERLFVPVTCEPSIFLSLRIPATTHSPPGTLRI